jgi:diguanylate cyclase (GGDEF)-like protein
MRNLAGVQSRPKFVIPIAVTVAVAIACVVVAVLSAANRADEVALETEQQLFTNALAKRAQRLIREIESVSASEGADQHIRINFAPEWAHTQLGLRLQSLFGHDIVFVVDAADRVIYASHDRNGEQGMPRSAGTDLKHILHLVRGHSPESLVGDIFAADYTGLHRATGLQAFGGRPAILAAVEVASPGQFSSDRDFPVLLSVKFIDDGALEDIASQLQLRGLRKLASESAASGDYVFNLDDDDGRVLARFAWTPKRPGAEIVQQVVPFVAVASGGFVLLATLGFGHMRRTAATIAAGETRLRHLALHDPLSGLPNRIFFGECLEAKIEKVRHGGACAAVFYLDLDHFKEVNDTLGHPAGDDLIRGVAQRLARTLRDGDIVARLGGDEFAIITPGEFDHGNLQAMAARLIAAICSPYSIAGQTIVIGASAGIVVINQHVAGAADVMRYADLALYRAKNEGRNRACVYDSAMDADLLKRKILEQELRAAIENNELRVAYQPIVNNSGETVVGVEALCRWTHPQRDEIAPSEFIAIAEHSGLIIPLGEQVLRRACLDGKAWPGLTVAVNVSALQFRRTDFVDMVERILSATDFDPARHELEITESTLLGNVETAELAMFRLRALGVRLALDDFGTGYSSLLYLRRFRFDKLKIDSSFVRSIERASDAAAIVHAVASLGRGLGMKVTAEGVETAGQQLFLRAAGVHCMQGYRFGRPCPAREIGARLAKPDGFGIAVDANDLAMAG